MSLFTKRYHPPGTSPGTLTRAAPAVAGSSRISLIEYSESGFSEKQDIPPDAARPNPLQSGVTWIHVQGDADIRTLKEIGDACRVHELALEDIVNSGQRPKVEQYEEQLFVILSHPILDDDFAGTEQVSLFLGDRLVISFHDGTHDPFETIRVRLRKKTGKLRSRGADFLFYALIDLVIDQCFPVLERYASELETLEEQLLEQPTQDVLRRLHELKRDGLLLRRKLWPQREVLDKLIRDDAFAVGDDVKLYFRDCYDHIIQIMELFETYREMATGLIELYLSSVSNRLNEVMRILTVIATIFIPLTFIVGVYGMNFGVNQRSPWAMPELNWYYGYPLTWGIMILIAGGLLYLFKRKGWF